METKFTDIMDMMLGVERLIKQMLIKSQTEKFSALKTIWEIKKNKWKDYP
jgi:hypothetical protein